MLCEQALDSWSVSWEAETRRTRRLSGVGGESFTRLLRCTDLHLTLVGHKVLHRCLIMCSGVFAFVTSLPVLSCMFIIYCDQLRSEVNLDGCWEKTTVSELNRFYLSSWFLSFRPNLFSSASLYSSSSFNTPISSLFISSRTIWPSLPFSPSGVFFPPCYSLS